MGGGWYEGASRGWIAVNVQDTVTASASIAKVGVKKTPKKSLSLFESKGGEMFLEDLG